MMPIVAATHLVRSERDAACWKNSFILSPQVIGRRDYRTREGLATTGNPGEGTRWLDRGNRWG